MKTIFAALMMSAVVCGNAAAQLTLPPPPVGNLTPPGTGTIGVPDPNVGPAVQQPVTELPPPPNQVGDPSITTGGPGTVILTNRGHIISEPVNVDDLHIDVTLVFPTVEVLPNNETYRDYIDICIGTDGTNGVQQNRPWGVLDPNTIIIRVFHTAIYVVEIGLPGPDGKPTQTLIGQSTINTGEGGLPLEVEILIHEGVVEVTTGGNGGAGGDPVIVDLPPGTNTSGNVIIYNRETVAGVTFEAEISNLTVTGTDPTPPLPPIAP